MNEKSTHFPSRLLVIGAHPDDIEFGCGAVLLKEHAAGAAIRCVITSRGEAGSNGTPAERESEARAAAARIGKAVELEFLDFGGDGTQRDAPENALQLAREIRGYRPTLVLAPTTGPNQHPDHAVVGSLTRTACRLARFGGLSALRDLAPHAIGSLWYYAITPTAAESRTGAVYIDISDQVEAWKELMACHATQMRTREYLDLQITRARQLGLEAGCAHAIALWPNDPPLIERLSDVPASARGF